MKASSFPPFPDWVPPLQSCARYRPARRLFFQRLDTLSRNPFSLFWLSFTKPSASALPTGSNFSAPPDCPPLPPPAVLPSNSDLRAGDLSWRRLCDHFPPLCHLDIAAPSIYSFHPLPFPRRHLRAPKQVLKSGIFPGPLTPLLTTPPHPFFSFLQRPRYVQIFGLKIRRLRLS